MFNFDLYRTILTLLYSYFYISEGPECTTEAVVSETSNIFPQIQTCTATSI